MRFTPCESCLSKKAGLRAQARAYLRTNADNNVWQFLIMVGELFIALLVGLNLPMVIGVVVAIGCLIFASILLFWDTRESQYGDTLNIYWIGGGLFFALGILMGAVIQTVHSLT